MATERQLTAQNLTVAMPQPDPAPDQYSRWLSVFAQVTDEAADEVDYRRALDRDRVGQDARRDAVLDYLRREDTFGQEYRRTV